MVAPKPSLVPGGPRLVGGPLLRIAQVAPPMLPVPPPGYGGIERVVGELTKELVRRGHAVTLFASGDSTAPGQLIPTVPKSLRGRGLDQDIAPYLVTTIFDVLDRAAEFDVIHTHLEAAGLLLAQMTPVPVVITFHNRLDVPWAPAALRRARRGLVAISQSQASAARGATWERIVYNGLDLSAAPFDRRRGDGFCFVGRINPEKGALDAIEIARMTGRPLKIAAKIGWTSAEQSYFDDVFKPALERADVEFLGELGSSDRDQLYAESYATLMPGSWPEPFGLVAIESMACGTPVLARRAGALPEIIRDGIDGFLADDNMGMAFRVDDIGLLDRRGIHESVLERFSASRMADGYEEVYRAMIAGEAEAEMAAHEAG
jgi:glycosyltransferase involved in cell wall biosynthesis